jgi:hypothetical protein
MSKVNLNESFGTLRIRQELKKYSDDELIAAIQEAHMEALKCTDEKEWVTIRDTVLLIGEELERRKVP